MALVFEDCELFQVISNLETEFLKKGIIIIWMIFKVSYYWLAEIMERNYILS